MAKLRRGRYLPLLLGLLLFGNGFLHLCYHAHLHGVSGAPKYSLGAAADDTARFGALHHLAAESAGEFFCPCCSSTVDWWCAPAAAAAAIRGAA